MEGYNIPVRLCNHADGFPEFANYVCPHCGFMQPEEWKSFKQQQKNKEKIELLTIDNVTSEVTMDENDNMQKYKARKFVELVQQGVTPGKAAEKIGTSLRKINNSTETKAIIADLLQTYAVAAEVRKELAKAALNRVLLESLNAGTLEGAKLAAQVAAQIAKEEGTTVETPAVTVDLGSLVDVLKDVTLDTKKEEINAQNITPEESSNRI